LEGLPRGGCCLDAYKKQIVFGLTDISIAFLTGSPIWVWAGLFGLLVMTWLLYRRTNPPLPVYLRIVLALVRVVAVLALIIALSEPVVSYSRQFERPRHLAVLMDRSISMEREEQGLSRHGRVDSIWSGNTASSLRANCDIETFYFGGVLDNDPAKILPSETALGNILNDLQRRQIERPYDAWLLFSDGRNNSGSDPLEVARSLNVPVTTVGIAAGGDEVDLALVDVDHNPVVFVGQPTETTVKISWTRAEGETVNVRLLDSTVLLAESQLAIDQESGFAEVTLNYIPARSGQRLLSFEISPLSEETETDNNRRTISVKAMRSRVAVLLVTGAPDYEVGFLHRFLQRSDRYEVEMIATGNRSGRLAGRIPSAQSELNRYDLIILHDPDPARLNSYRGQLRSYLADRGGAIWFLFGRQFASRATPDWLTELLPFYLPDPSPVAYGAFHGLPAESQLFHPVIRLADDRAEVREIWANLPPFKALVPCVPVERSGVILAFADTGSRFDVRPPVLGYRRVGPGKVLAQAALPLWTWGFETLTYNPDNDIYDRIVESSVNWLTVEDDFDPIRIIPVKEIFSRSESVRFDGFAFDQGFRPLPGVDGNVVVTNSDTGEKFEMDLLERGEGAFETEFSTLPPGEYTYRAQFSKGGQVLKTNEGRLLVESFSLEEYDQRGDPAMLMALARATGGRYVDFADFDAVLTSLDQTPVIEEIDREIKLFGKLWLLLLFVGALAVEWLLRKLNHLL